MATPQSTKKKRGKAAPSKGTGEEVKVLLLRVPETLHTNLRVLAVERGKSLNEILGEVLEKWYRSQPEARRRRRQG